MKQTNKQENTSTWINIRNKTCTNR